MIRGLRHSLRLLTILVVLARTDAFPSSYPPALRAALFPLRLLGKRSSLRPGQKLALALEQLGPCFIKLGQTLSTRADLVGEQMAEDLAGLRDHLPPFPSDIAKGILARDGTNIADHFSRFDEIPVAAASIAQVHRARLTDGREVAVKLLRPGIHDIFRRDLALFSWAAEKIERHFPRMRRLKPREIVRTLEESVTFELDLRMEAAAAAELASNMQQHHDGFRVPEVMWPLTSSSVLVMEWMEGTPIHDSAALDLRGHSPQKILEHLAESFFHQVFRDGFFHADLHPGNLFVDAQGRIAAVDFGIMGRVGLRERHYIAEIFHGFLNEDYMAVARAHFAAGYVPAHKSMENFAQACMAIAKPILDLPMREISMGRLLGHLFAVTETFEMQTQPQLLLLQKSLVLVEGVGRMLNPNVNMWEVARAPIEAWAKEQYGWFSKIRSTSASAHGAAQHLPLLLRQIEQAMNNASDPQGIRLHPETLAALRNEPRAFTPARIFSYALALAVAVWAAWRYLA